jgi:predicted acyl esterase
LRRRWFDRWIKGLGSGVDEEPAVRVFVMGGGSGRRNRDSRLDHGLRWRNGVEWPLPQTRWTRLYLHADRSLAAAPATGSGALDYAFDPRDPVPTAGGAISSGEPVMHDGAFDQDATALRSNDIGGRPHPRSRQIPKAGRCRVE